MLTCKDVLGRVWDRMRKKKLVSIDDAGTELERCLTRRRLTLIGLANTVGVGIYVLIGVATKEYAGPSVVLSFVIAFFVTLLNALCFSEYASRTPKTGAQYTFLYQTIGEAVAFIVGWSTIIIAASAFSSSCRAWSGYVDSIFHHAIENFTIKHIANWTSHGQPFPPYPDFIAIVMVVIVTVITSVGVNFSSWFTSILATMSCLLLSFITILGFIYADWSNWFNDVGGFFPYGISGVLRASSACFYAFQGYDVVAMSAEEAINPEKSVPQAVMMTLVLVTVLYLGVAVSFTLMVPYQLVNINAPLSGAFQYHSVMWAKYIISVGTVLTLANLCALSLFGVQRLIYSMASDGLLFKCFSVVNERTKVPIRPVLAIGPLVIALILSIDLSNLIKFMVIYGFIQSSFFAAYMIVLRYEPIDTAKENIRYSAVTASPSNDSNGTNHNIQLDMKETKMSDIPIHQSKNNNEERCLSRYQQFTEQCRIKHLVLIVTFACFLLSIELVKAIRDIEEGNPLAISSVIVLTFIVTIATMFMWTREQRGESKGFLVPLMPFIPVLTIFCNMLLLVSIAEKAVVVAAIIFPSIGMIVYLCIVTYGVLKSDSTDWTTSLAEQKQDDSSDTSETEDEF